jgi:hypothetical protein
MENNEILEELKKINERLDKNDEMIKILHDLLIEYITLKTVTYSGDLNIKKVKGELYIDEEEKSSSSVVDSKTLKKKKEMKDINYKLKNEEIEKIFYNEFNKKNYLEIEEKLGENSNSNKLNIFKWLYIHFGDKREKVITTLQCEEYLEELYKTIIIEKKPKDITELFKCEILEILKKYKLDEPDKITKLTNEFKVNYEKITNDLV